MRRFAAVFLSAILLVSSFTGCGTKETDPKTEKEETTKAAEVSTTAAPEAATTEQTTSYDKVEIHKPEKVDQTGKPEEGETIAIIHVKDYGDISLKFFYEDSPLAVENFLTLAANGYYDGIIFHRVIDQFMIQGGDPTGTGMGGESMWGDEFANEYSDRLAHINGSIAMARTQALDTNGSQFFINNGPTGLTEDQLSQYGLSDEIKEMYLENGGNPYLQDQYTVFGQVYEGMDVVEAISSTATDTNDKPVVDIVIESVDVTQYGK